MKMNFIENEKNLNLNFVDGAHLKPQELIRRLNLLDCEKDIIMEMDFENLINTYNTIISSNDNLRLSKIKYLLDEDSQRQENIEETFIKKRERDNEYFSYNKNQRDLNNNSYSISPGQSGNKR
jgi:hypothetical protein